VTPDYQIEVREDVLIEKDGPMLLHGLQGFHGATLRTPRSELLKPNRDFLAERYALFKRTA
jgi:putative restriction endonuclease